MAVVVIGVMLGIGIMLLAPDGAPQVAMASSLCNECVLRRKRMFERNALFSLVLASSSPLVSPDDPLWLILVSALGALVLTWGLGLAPILLIRYAVARRPLSRRAATKIAAGSCAFFWILYRLLEVGLGEKPTSGIAWLLVFFVARWIMCRGYVPSAPQTPPEEASTLDEWKSP